MRNGTTPSAAEKGRSLRRQVLVKRWCGLLRTVSVSGSRIQVSNRKLSDRPRWEVNFLLLPGRLRESWVIWFASGVAAAAGQNRRNRDESRRIKTRSRKSLKVTATWPASTRPWGPGAAGQVAMADWLVTFNYTGEVASCAKQENFEAQR